LCRASGLPERKHDLKRGMAVILCRASGLPERKHDLKRGVAVILGRASGLPKRKHNLKRRLALDLGLALDEEQADVAQGLATRRRVEADVVQGLATRCRVEADVVQGLATRRRVGTDVAQGLATRSRVKIDETDETDEINETDETDEINVSSVQRDPAAGNVTQREAERLKNARALVRSKKEFYLNPLESLPSRRPRRGRGRGRGPRGPRNDLQFTYFLPYTYCPMFWRKSHEAETGAKNVRTSVV
jgi:hypothetical protein